MTEYHKLVRDRVPEIIHENGETPETHVAEDAEYRMRLREKLCEEAEEFRESGDTEELADVLDVVEAIRAAEDIDREELANLRKSKTNERGGFGDGIVLERVVE